MDPPLGSLEPPPWGLDAMDPPLRSLDPPLRSLEPPSPAATPPLCATRWGFGGERRHQEGRATGMGRGTDAAERVGEGPRRGFGRRRGLGEWRGREALRVERERNELGFLTSSLYIYSHIVISGWLGLSHFQMGCLGLHLTEAGLVI